MKIKSIILDDEPLARKLLLDYSKKVEFLDIINDFSDPLEAISFLDVNPIDLLFLDIKMPELNGLSFLKMLRRPPKVIFTTAFSEYAVEGFELEAIDYLLKPFDFPRFYKAVDKVRDVLSLRSAIDSKASRELLVKEGHDWMKLPLESIQYIKGQKDYVLFCTTKKRVMSLMNMKDLELELREEGFMRVHQSYIINTHRIDSISHERVIIDGESIPVSISYRVNVKAYIEAH